MASEKDATCENDPNFAVVCAFFQKFTTILNVQHPDFKLLQEWLENTDEVAEGLKLLHIKLLRKLRKTVHESAWESALSKFCFGYSAQDAWEIERFGYKKSSLKVKLRVLKELVESQFQRNGKFRNTFSLMNANELRSQPIGRDKLGNSYWLTQDPNLNLRIYQEHLDEEIWQVVASSREELVTLINRLKGNEVVLPSLVGIVDEDTSSSNSCPFLVKSLPPEEKEEDEEEIVEGITTAVEATTNNEGKVPNIKIKIERKSDAGCVKKDKTNENQDQSNNYEDGSEEEDDDDDDDDDEEEEEEEEDDNDDDDDEEEEDEEEHDNDNAKSNDENKDQKVAVSRYLKRNKLKIENVKKANETVRNSLAKSTIQKGNNGEDNDNINISETIGKSSIKEKAKDEENKKTSDKSSLDEIKTEKRVKPIVISQSKNLKVDIGQQLTKKRSISAVIDELKNSNKEEEDDLLCNTLVIKKPRPTLLDSAAMKKKVGKYEEYDEDEESEEEGEEEEEGDNEEEEEEEEEDDEGGGEGEEESDNIGDEIEEKTMVIKGVGNGEECESGNNFFNFFPYLHKLEDSDNVEVSEVIEEEIMIFKGEGYGEDCLVGNSKEEKQTDNSKFYFGQPGCLKLSPIKKKIEIDETKKIILKSNESGDKPNNDNENKSSDKLVADLKNGENEKKEEKEQNEEISNEDKSIKLGSETIPASIKVKNEVNKQENKEEEKIIEKEQTPEGSLLRNALEKIPENLKEEKNIENDKLNDKTKPTNLDEKSKLANISVTEEIKVTITENCEKKINQTNEKQIISSPSEKVSSSNIYNDCSKSKCGSSRKRRLSENVCDKQQQSYKQKSESETDINCDNQFDEIVDDLGSENEEEIVSGKRPKMRPKLINSDIRRKIEAKRNDIQQETSNSSSCSETEQKQLPRKPPLPKKLELKTSISIKSQKNVVDREKELESKIKKDLEKKCDINSGELIQIQSGKNIEVSQKAKSLDKLPQNKKVENDNQEVSERQSSYDNISSSEITDKNKEKSDIKNENDKKSDIKSPTKTTRSTRRSTTEPLYQDLPHPKRKARGAAANSSGLRKNSTIKIEESPMNLTKVKQEVKTKVEIKTNQSDSHVISTQSEDSKSNIENVKGSQMPSVPETKQKEVESSTNSPLDCKSNETIKKENEKINGSQDQKTKNSTDTEQLTPSLSKVVEQQDQSTTVAATPKKKQQRRKREIDISNIIPESEIPPVRQSRRIAQLKIKEEAERRKLEEVALKKMKDDLKKKKKEESKLAGKPVEVSEHSESSKEVDSEADVKKKVEKKRKKRNGWSSCTESEGGEEDEDELIFDHHDYDRVSPFKSDHEFSPESELEDSSEVVPLKRARTARKEGECATEDDVKDDQACQKCGKKDHPEWILLCDKCDKGYHCSCLSPVLFIIPEGDWFCPPCQQEQLIIALENHLKEFDQLLEKKKEDEIKKEEALKAAQEAEEAKMARRNRNIQRQKNKQYSRQRDDYDDDDDDDDDSEDEEEEYGEREDKSKEQKNERNDRIEKRKKKIKDRGRSYESNRRFSSRSSSKSFSTSSLSTESNSNSSSSQFGDSDDEPIYKLRKRRQINVSYRFNEFDDLINSAIKDEMDEVAGAGNLGRGKDISTIIEADKEEKLRQKQLQKEEAAKREFTTTELEIKTEKCSSKEEENPATVSDQKEQSLLVTDDNKQQNEKIKVEDETLNDNNSGSDFEPLKRKPKMSSHISKKKKSRKLNSLDVSSEDDGSDEDFKTSSYETDEDEEESLSVPTESESSLEMYKRKKKSSRNKKPKKKKTRRAARRAAARNRNKQYEYDSDFVVDDSDEEVVLKPKKKRKDDSDYTESLTDEDDDLSEDVDSDELCDDSTDSESDGAWRPSKRKKQRTINKKKLPPLLSTHKRPVLSSEGKHKKVKRKHDAEKSFRVNISKKNKIHDDDDDDDSVDGRGRKTRGKRFTYLEDYEEESSDDGIKPGVKRPDTPPEEREEFIRKQEEIKRMLAEKNTEAAKVVATPVPKISNSEKRSTAEAVPVVETSDSLSTVPLSVIKGAKALDIDYLQRRGELQHESGDDQDTDFDDDLPDDFNPEDMDEEAIAKMMEEEDFAQQQLKLAGEVIQKKKAREIENLNRPPLLSQPDIESLNKISKPSQVLQEPPRKRLPIPTIQPPLIRNAPQSTIIQNNLQVTATSRMEISNPSRTVPQQNIIVPPHKNISLLPSGNNSLLQSSPKDFRSPIPAKVSLSPEPQMRSSTIQHQPNELEKPKGRRKKITPLRDTLQKQQAAAAAAAAAAVVTAAAATAAVKTTKEHQTPGKQIVGIPEGSLLSIAQPPQLYKPNPNAQPSVITRMPQSPRARFEQSSRFYPPPSQLLHRMPQRLPGIPLSQHPSLRPSYATGPPPLRPVSNNGPPPPVSIDSGLVRHPPSIFGNPEQFSRTRQPLIHPPYRPPLYGTPGYPLAPPPQQLPSPQQSSASQVPPSSSPHKHPSSASQRQLPSAPQQSSASPHHHLQTPPLHSPSPNNIHPGAGSYPVTSFTTGPGTYGSYYPPHSTPQQLTAPHSTPPPPTITAVPSSVIVSAGSITVQQQQQQVAAVSISDTTIPSPPPPSTSVPPPSVLVTESRPKASTLETFNTKSNSSSLEAESTQSPYSSNEPADDNDDEIDNGNTDVPTANATSEFSGLVSYFSSQQDDLDT